MKGGWNRCKKVSGVIENSPGYSRDEDVEVLFGSNEAG